MNRFIHPSLLSPAVEQANRTQEQLLAGIIGSAMDSIITIDQTYHIVLFNAAAEIMFRCRAEDALGKPLDPFLPEAFRATHTQQIAAFANDSFERRSMGHTRTIFGRRFDGEEFPIEASIAKVEIDGGAFFTVILRDITERRQAEEALQKSEARFRDLANAMPQIVYVANAQGTIEYLNQQAIEAMGLADVTQMAERIHPEDLAQVRQRWLDSLQTGEPYQSEHRIYLQPSGEARWFLSRALPVYGVDGRIVKWYGTATDIQAQKETAAELDRTTKLLQAVMNGASDGIFVKDPAGRYFLVNPALARFVNLTPEEMLGKDDRSIFADADAEQIMSRDATVIQTKKVHRYESQLTVNGKVQTYMGTRSPLFDDDGEAIGIIGIVHDITARKVVEEAMRENERRLQIALGAAQMGVWEWSVETIYWSPECYTICGMTPAGNDLADIVTLVHPDDKERVLATIREAIAQKEKYVVEFRSVRPDSGVRWVLCQGNPLYDDAGKLIHIIGIVQDITTRVQLEEQLRQAQKMDAIGQLAGGVAHDFNNLLTVITGYSTLLLAKLSDNERNQQYVQNIHDAGERAAALTRQLLAFSRKQILEPKVVDLNEIIDHVEGMLQRLIGDDITLRTVLAARRSNVKVDPNQIEQVVINLSINARDAMPWGGYLTLETHNILLDKAYCRVHPEIKPGLYVRLSLSDTGVGITPSDQRHIFEPFFTTKEAGKGTGLGLATVFGIVKQSGGHIKVYSETGVGTCFKIYLPVVGAATHEPIAQPLVAHACGEETVLLVEDDAAVRKIAKLALKEYGYRILEAQDGADALQVVKRQRDHIHLLLTDVVMPRIGGSSLVEKLRKRLPNLKVLYMSGYTDDAVVRHSILHEECAFINKPFSPVALAQKVREVLDSAQNEQMNGGVARGEQEIMDLCPSYTASL